jgi:hypothetical protein
MANEPITANSKIAAVAAVHGSAGDPGTGVFGETAGGGHGVRGFAATVGQGVHGASVGGRGVVGISETFFGVSGQSKSGVGVSGESTTNVGVFGKSPSSFGVQGVSETNHGVHGDSTSGRGVQGISETFIGVSGVCKGGGSGVTGESASGAGVVGISKTGIGVHGRGSKLAALFEGDVEVTGDIRLANADCAEYFDIADPHSVEPGTVMVLGAQAELRESHQAYDKRVAGVISGAGSYRPGIVLDKQTSKSNRLAIGLLGKVYCKVEAQSAPIAVGDLLTTSNMPGHAMKASDSQRTSGAIIGKALRPLLSGQGLIPILITLQ